MNHTDTTESLMLDHAAGTLPDALALVVDSHMALNEEARGAFAVLEMAGGALLDELDTVDVSDTALDHVLARLERPAEDKPVVPQPRCTDTRVPAAIRRYLPGNLNEVKWSRTVGGVKEYRLPVESEGFKASLLAIEPGRAIPNHTHKGTEYTVVLEGSYSDENEMVGTGDLVIHDARHSHMPIADPEVGCLCLAVLSAPLKFKGPLGVFLNPFQRL